MQHSIKSIRPFIGAKDYELSRAFYKALGFTEVELGPAMCVFNHASFAFYLQKYYVKDWIDNTMIFVEVDDVNRYYNEINALDLPIKFPGSRLIPIRHEAWGKEFFLHDPSGILWHFGQFSQS
jgi:catechol 2,3-dioxygenase-like lactoylglutathione lyase family enzyme